MFVLIWMTLLFSADTGESLKEKQQCSESPSGYCITLLDGQIRAQAALCAEIPCYFTTASKFTPQSLVWYKCEPTTENCGDSDIIFDSRNNNNVQSEFKGRVSMLEPDLSQKTCSIIISDLKESDSGLYQLRVNGVQNGRESGFTYSPRANVSVKGLIGSIRLEVPPLILGQPATITCTAPGRYCPGSDPKFTWIWPVEGEDYDTVDEGHTSTLTFTPSSKHHYTDVSCKVTFIGNITKAETWTMTVKSSPVEGTQHCDSGNCITLPDGKIIAEAGLCVEIPCSFETSLAFKPEHVVWYKCEPTNENCSESDIIFDSENAHVASKFRGRVLLWESDMRMKVCTIIINDLKESDSGSYQLRLNGIIMGKKGGYTFSPRATLSVEALSQKPKMKIHQLFEEGQNTTLTCTAPGLCSGSDPIITWTWSRAGEDLHFPDQSINHQRRTSTLTLIPSAEQHGAEVTCKVTFTGNEVTQETAFVNVRLSQPGSNEAAAWAIAGVSLCVNVFCFIIIFFLWNARKKMKSNQDIRMHRSPGDDGSDQPLH